MPVVVDWVVPTGLPVASTGLLEVAAVGLPAVLDRLGAISPELPWLVLAGLVVVPAGAVPVVVCACAVKLSIPKTAKAAKSVLLMIVN